MANDLNRSIKIYIDGTPAAQGVATVEAAIQKLETKLSALSTSEANYETKSRKLKKELETKYKTLQNYKTKVQETETVLNNLSGSSYNKLIAVQALVRKQLRDATPDTEQYNAALDQNRRVTEAVTRAQQAMRVEVGCQGTTLGKAVGLFNKYAAVVTAGVAAITGVTLKLNQLREKRNQREEAKADVKALTGLDDDSINWLEQEAKRLSTSMDEAGIRIRQSATEILDAYKLVGSAKPELLNDKEALAEVTKQTLILASASGMTLKDAVDAVTLSLNQYGDGADQAARYANIMAAGSKFGSAAVEAVTAAVKKSGVAASSANIPIEQLVGSIETLAEKGIKDEIAGTGLKKFFLTLQTGADETNPKIVGLEAALNNLQQQQLSAAQVKKMFGEEGYNVASVLINEAEKVQYYTEAVTGTTVAVEQAAIKSTTAAAKLDQAKNKMNEMGIALMDKLNPAIVSSINGVVNWGRKIVDLVDFITRNIGTIITLTTAIVSYYTAVKIATVHNVTLRKVNLVNLALTKLEVTWNKTLQASILLLSAAKFALTGNINRATAAMRLFGIITKMSPIGILVSAIATLGVGLYLLFNRTNSVTDAMKRMNGEILTEQHSLDSLFSALNKTTEGSQDRRDIIQEINEKYGTYLPNLLTEKSNLDEINDAYKRINRSLVEQIALKYKNEEIRTFMEGEEGWFGKDGFAKTQIEAIEGIRSELEKRLGSGKLANMAINDIKRTTEEYNKAGMKWEKAFGQAYDTIKAKYFGGKSLGNDIVSSNMEKYIKNVYKMKKEIDRVEKKYSHWMQQTPENEIPEIVITAKKTNNTTGGETEEEKTARLAKEQKEREEAEQRIKIALNREKALYTQQQADIKKLYAAGNDETLKTQQQYDDRMLELKKEHLNRIIDIAGKGSSEAVNAENQLADIQLQERKATADSLSKARDKELADEQQFFDQQKKAYEIQLLEKKLTKQQYDIFIAATTSNHSEKVLKIEKEYYDKAKELVKQGEETIADLVEQSHERITKATLQSTKDRLAAEETYMKNLGILRDMASHASTSPIDKETAAYEAKLVQLEAIYQASIKYAEITGKDTLEIKMLYDAAIENAEKEYRKNIEEIRRGEVAKTLVDPFQQEVFKAYTAIEELKELMNNFSDYTEEEFKEKLAQTIGKLVNSVTNGLSNAFNTFQQIEIDNIEAKYNAEIEAAAGNSEKIEQLEREKAQKKLDIEKKYADVQFAIKASQIIANTAMAIMQCLAQLGPIAGPIMAGVMAATGAIQLASANAERQKVKSQTLDGGSSLGGTSHKRVAVPQHAEGRYDVIGVDDNKYYSGVPYIGTSPTGIVRSPALISENGAELIVNAEDLRRLQRHVNYPLVLQAINESRQGSTKPVPQHAEGSYPIDKAPSQESNSNTNGGLSPELLERLANAIIRLDEQGARSFVVLSDLEKKQVLRNRSRQIGSKH
ncbi:phage tail tape measure protein [Bacteroides sp. UBA939]|uniref:phage tail tape measure protein n=1 Tax=Bacteroides sp. UBA939 TaxID=1946092 RepID=UPI0025C4D667|nr:phage tail tape measure protein [Bacteroides sp. UBA939]